MKDIVCEHEFDQEDGGHPGFSLTEMDFYRWVPASKQGEVRGHRLTLRKNLSTGDYELYRHYYDDESDVVIFRFKDFQKALDQVVVEWNYAHGGWAGNHEPIYACKHVPPQKSTLCFAKI